ncbi:hypothetical protein OESDEN_02619 [Oesophagostomum dentatum]|uniref:G-protein coupled receptors family 1 profile domain-containing protein n=1 Tax=Oesophagostomum dentatum TaxID=61180 RepID=A0A0B1TJH1_OESDE|nr:hypothetical protein OESDEN_02619 [Oesophagostomum dentatum]
MQKMTVSIPIFYQVFYVVIPAISLIGNCSVIYVTIRSSTLRSACNIFIALISLGDALHTFAHFVMISTYYISLVFILLLAISFFSSLHGYGHLGK